jgi:hypothetical protein
MSYKARKRRERIERARERERERERERGKIDDVLSKKSSQGNEN